MQPQPIETDATDRRYIPIPIDATSKREARIEVAQMISRRAVVRGLMRDAETGDYYFADDGPLARTRRLLLTLMYANDFSVDEAGIMWVDGKAVEARLAAVTAAEAEIPTDPTSWSNSYQTGLRFNR